MKRLLTIVFVLLAVPVMAQEHLGVSPKTDKTLPDVLGVCGPIHRAIFELGPKKYDPQLDTGVIWVQEIGPGMNIVIFPAPEETNSVLPDRPPMALQLYEFKGKVQAAAALWPGSVEDCSAIWHDLLDHLIESMGQPTEKEDDFVKWQGGLINTAISWSGEDEDLVISWSCQPTEDEYFNAQDEAENSKEEAVAKAGGSNEATGHDPWKRESIVSIIKGYGQPTDAPVEIGEDVVGLHYGDLDMNGFPYEIWYWFFEGREIYSAMKIPPVGGFENAVESFATMRKMTLEKHGLPDENTFDEDGVRQRMVWRKGSQTYSISFVDEDEHPWFLVETSDTEHLDKIEGELRPSSTLPNRYEPPPPDSGKVNTNFASEGASG